jgi:hypothetical protein
MFEGRNLLLDVGYRRYWFARVAALVRIWVLVWVWARYGSNFPPIMFRSLFCLVQTFIEEVTVETELREV